MIDVFLVLALMAEWLMQRAHNPLFVRIFLGSNPSRCMYLNRFKAIYTQVNVRDCLHIELPIAMIYKKCVATTLMYTSPFFHSVLYNTYFYLLILLIPDGT